MTRHLVLVYDPRYMDRNDFVEVSRLINERAPDIRVFLADNRAQQRSLARRASMHPSLVVCPFRLKTFEPIRGKVYQGRQMGKIRQYQHFSAAGVPAPDWTIVDPQTRLEPEIWGPAVVLKPEFGLQGRYVRLVPTEHVADHVAKYGETMVGVRPGRTCAQRFIDTGDPVASYRVLSFMSVPIMCNCLTIKRSALARLDDPGDGGANIAVNSYPERKRHWVAPPEMLDLARRVHDTLPQRPVLGVDIVREATTGRLYVLEVNAGGIVWHLSSPYALALYRRDGDADAAGRYKQFDALNIISTVLIERTRAEAE